MNDRRAAEPEPVGGAGRAPRAGLAPDRAAPSPAASSGYSSPPGPGAELEMAGDRAVEQAASDIGAYQSAPQPARRGGLRAGPADGMSMPQDRPARGSLAELRLRLERLPAGHPSSPYDDTGAFRPSPQQLRQLELPLADEERDADPPARASLLAATAGTGGSAPGRLSLDAGPSSGQASNGAAAGAARPAAGQGPGPDAAASAAALSGFASRPEPDRAGRPEPERTGRPDAYRSASGLDAFRTDRLGAAGGTSAGTSGAGTAGRGADELPADDGGGARAGQGLRASGPAGGGQPARSEPDAGGPGVADAYPDSAAHGPAGPDSASYRTASPGRTRYGTAGPDSAPHGTADPGRIPHRTGAPGPGAHDTAGPDSAAYGAAGPDSAPHGTAGPAPDRTAGPGQDSSRYGGTAYDSNGYLSGDPGAGPRLPGPAAAGYGTDRGGARSGATGAAPGSGSRDSISPGVTRPGPTSPGTGSPAGASQDQAARRSAYGEAAAGHSGSYPRPDLGGSRARRPEERGEGHDTASYRVIRRDPGGRGTVLQGTVLHDTDEPGPPGPAGSGYPPAARNGAGAPERPEAGPDAAAPGAADPGDRPAASRSDPLAAAPAADGTSPRLTAAQDRLANDELERYRVADGRNVFGGYGENGLTPAMRRVEAQLPHGQLAPDSEQYSLKSPERYKAKLARMIARHPGVPARDLAAEIYDTARFTFVFDPDQYTDGTWMVHRRLKAQGFELEVRRNRWESPEAKGIRTRWRDPAQNLAFEVQFHTPASWDVLQRTHEAYLRITDPQTPPEERAQLRARQVAAAAATRPPVRSSEIGDFRADVR